MNTLSVFFFLFCASIDRLISVILLVTTYAIIFTGNVTAMFDLIVNKGIARISSTLRLLKVGCNIPDLSTSRKKVRYIESQKNLKTDKRYFKSAEKSFTLIR